LAWIERCGAKSYRPDQKADGFPLSGLVPSEAHTDTIIPKALLDNIPKRDEMKDSKEGWKHKSINTRMNSRHIGTIASPLSMSLRLILYLRSAICLRPMLRFKFINGILTQCDQWLN
jgi:hypothetical protein